MVCPLNSIPHYEYKSNKIYSILGFAMIILFSTQNYFIFLYIKYDNNDFKARTVVKAKQNAKNNKIYATFRHLVYTINH